MKVEVKKVDATKRELTFEVPKERVSQRLEEVYGEIMKGAKVRGFRPGKAPRHVIEREHGKAAQEKMMERLIPEVYQEALQQEQLSPIDFPEIHDVKLKEGKLCFRASLDIKPEFSVKDYKGIKVQRKPAQITEEEISKTLDFFKTAQGKDKEVVLDDEFAKGLGYPTLEELKNSFRRQMEIEKDRQNRADVENQVIDFLIKNTKVTVPQATVERHLDRLAQDARARLEKQNLKPEEIEKRLEEFVKNVRPGAERDVKAYFILEKIAEQEQMSIQEGENVFQKVMAFLLKEANWEEAKEHGKT